MKKLRLLFIVLAFIGCKEEVKTKEKEKEEVKIQEIKKEEGTIGFDDITNVDGITYLKHDMSIVTGKVKDYWRSGKLNKEITFKDGKKNGLSKVWWSNGQLKEAGTYLNGKLHGQYEAWYDDGQKMYMRNYKNDIHIGNHILWYEDGRLKKEETYKDGELIFKQEWDEDGNEL